MKSTQNTVGYEYYRSSGLTAMRTVILQSGVNAVILSLRERQVLLFVSSGAQNKEIAARLGISLSTVKAHLLRVSKGLGAHNRVELTLWALAQPAALSGCAVPTRLAGGPLPLERIPPASLRKE